MAMILTQGSKLANVGMVGGTPCRASRSRKAFKVQATSWVSTHYGVLVLEDEVFDFIPLYF
jgi:hypothetical protein